MDTILFEIIFFLLAMIPGFMLGSTRCFKDVYEIYSEEYDKEKQKEKDLIQKFREMDFESKELLYRIYKDGSVILWEDEFTNDIRYGAMYKILTYADWETWSENEVRLMLIAPAQKFLKKHPELLDCVK
jgi:hypothetical protein